MPEAHSAAFAAQRRNMVDCQVRPYDVTDQILLERLEHVPREIFLPVQLKAVAYSDAVLTVPGATPRKLLAPMVLARMIQSLELKSTDNVLDVAGGQGYSAAVLAGLVAKVTALESDAALSGSARANFAAGGLANVEVATGSLSAGCAANGPYNAILVNGAVATGLEALLSQLADGGRLVCIDVASRAFGSSQAVRYDKSGDDIGSRRLFPASAALLAEFAPAPEFAF